MSWNPSTAKCDFPFLNESKGSAFWQGMITFFRIIFYSLPAPPLAIGALLLFSFFSQSTIYHIMRIAKFSSRSAKP